jgi:hypothetical protein
MNRAFVINFCRWLLCSALVCACLADSLAEVLKESIRLTSSVSVDNVRVGQPFQLSLIVESSDPIHAALADPAQSSLGDFHLVTQQTLGPRLISGGDENVADRFQSTLVLQLETARAGERRVPPISIDVRVGEEVVTLVSEPVKLMVAGVVPADFDPTQFRKLKPLAEFNSAQESPSSWFWWVAPLVCVMGGLALLWRKSRNRDAAIRKRWIAEIDALETQVHNQSISLPIAHDEACTRIRQWIEWSYRFSATSLPTDQLIDALQSRSWPSPMLDRLSSMLRSNDQMKFANQTHSPEALSSVFDDARWLIRHPLPSLQTANAEVHA